MYFGFLAIIAVVIAIVVVVVMTAVPTAGGSVAGALTVIGTAVQGAITAHAGGLIMFGLIATTAIAADQAFLDGKIRITVVNLIGTALGNNIVFPLFSYGPEEIFSGKILLFDANIFEPKEVFVRTKAAEVTVPAEEWNNMDQSKYEFVRAYYEDPTVSTPEHVVGENALVTYKHKVEEGHVIPLSTWNQQVKVKEEYQDEEGNIKERYVYKYIYRSGLEAEEYFYEDGEKEIPTSINNSAYELKNIISKWYYIIRNISIVALMLVLLYVGIRMLLSTVASEKSKYKQMFADWVVAVCLIFLLHYIMVFGHYFTERITSILSNAPNSDLYTITISEPKANLVDQIKQVYPEMIIKDGSGNDVIQWPTNLMGVIRGKSQERNSGSLEFVGYTICYLVLVIFTATFTITYIKRLVMLLFLTVIAPFVAFTYPIDKLRDGKAQAFDFWLKEYVTNLLIQPFHLLLYTMFISMAFELSSTNIVYSLVVIGFMVPSEKILRKIFSLDKAESAGLLSGATGAAMALSAMNSLNKFANKKKEDKKDSGKSANEKDDKINFMDGGKTTKDLLKEAVNDGSSPAQMQLKGGTNENDDKNKDSAENSRLGNEEKEFEEDDNNEKDNKLDFSKEEIDGEEQGEEENSEIMNSFDEKQNNGQNEEIEKVNESVGSGLNIANNGNNSGETIGKKDLIARYLAARALNFRRRNINTKKIAGIAKTGGRWASKLAFGALGAGIGLASGIATGKLDDVAKNTVTGAFAGSSIGQGLYNRGESALSSAREKSKAYHEEALRDVYGDEEYKRRQRKKLAEEFKRNAETRKVFQSAFNPKSKQELDDIMEQAFEIKHVGKITDNEAIIRALKLNPNHQADSKVLAAARLSKQATSEKGLEDAMKRFKEETGLGDNDPQLKEMKRRIRIINDML